MRQWHVPPEIMCREHLCGEHVEHHMLAGTLLRGRSVNGYLRKGLLEVMTLFERHDELVAEMLRRGYNHQSPMPEELREYLYPAGHVDRPNSLSELYHRCPRCRARIAKFAA